ncbi:MAG TPA: NAD(P)H-dependent oxidoreductase [Candidatus Eisenbergiella merdavium]|uniref:NAD(P)H-dependent oxidoreductase n=1 Tax=Candidatus Eisenbergiella merdavium TaxID=2838551 RepID=A0A9D2SQ74_9FIRM|nr:NAD(P)H-dependent oxidoreductase [Candidatus Eisenbergiella merdavium]
MKKILSFVLILTMVFSLAACGNSGTPESSTQAATSGPEGSDAPEENTPSSESTAPTESVPQDEESSQPETETGSTSLVVYFSWSGNTESVATEIQPQTGADIFEIVPSEPYTDDYDTLLDIAQDEQANDARPAIAQSVENFDQYETVYFGFPNWWGDMPMILYTFLDDYDFSGKTIAPFVTSGGSGFSGTIESMEPDATVTEGLSLGSSEAADPAAAVTEWLAGIGLAE